MNDPDWQERRRAAIHLLRSGRTPTEVAKQLGHSISWVCKCRDRYEEEGWAGLADRSRAPHRHGRAYPETVRQAICQARSELEAEAATKTGLKYIGSSAVQARMAKKEDVPVPSTATIERVLRAAEMVKRWPTADEPNVEYPHLHPTEPHQLCQVDIVPHYLRGGEAVACFNGIDVASRYPTGQPKSRRRSQEATEFLVHTWQEIGIPSYTQVDNEGCFSGGFTHPGVLGKVIRLALHVGTELVFSPFYHPASNGTVERFHQDYDRHVWDETELQDVPEVAQQSDTFFANYRHSHHHSALKGQTPSEVHHQTSPTRLSSDFKLPPNKLPLTEGRVHFIRRVSAARTIKVLNLEWAVPNPDLAQGVWVTIEFKVSGATLYIYDDAPDAAHRTCLAVYPFPIKEEVLPQTEQGAHQRQVVPLSSTTQPVAAPNLTVKLLLSVVYYKVKAASRFVFTMH